MARSLARMDCKIPESKNHQTLIDRLLSRSPAKLRWARSSPPTALPTRPLLAMGRGHSSPATHTHSHADTAPSPNSHPHPCPTAKALRFLADTSPSHPVRSAQPVSAAIPAVTPARAYKPSLYRTRRGPPRCAWSAIHPHGFARELASRSPRPTVAPVECGAHLLLSHTGAGSPGERRRQGVPVFADDIRTVLRDVIEAKEREEQEELLLAEFLNGRMVGGQGRYQRVKIVPASTRVDASPAWMTTLF
ncbi:hypothetical protein DFH07DRAFT_957503 [Mycena maculata]|uniref:Uncharacterized protein n=1 Tax=Mycena maculata TaxID=230809 RepID=A0AAD7JAY0_9AGAR|nr:hypothetical protein DFH07DRAFT_957503 [Mycena maculata]